jgi:hypothetical protein
MTYDDDKPQEPTCWGESGAHDISDEAVCCPCPKCCEANPDKLVWQADGETVRCTRCGHEYKPGE